MLSEKINKQYSLKYTDITSHKTLRNYNTGYDGNKGVTFENIKQCARLKFENSCACECLSAEQTNTITFYLTCKLPLKQSSL